ncbi:hypothetical protein AVEN_52482-1 [Araneus ventricosus]|uniref:Uncharacterized protein n=1 Tax=Araneus ventricosus TaxID=182803 RepID=A0A4Y2CX38_ARAVE|nr:hypothetical protein AVEN_52482-1 [Araneus ventricosus]
MICPSINLGLVILTSHFGETQRLFWNGLCNFELWSENEDNTLTGTPSPNYCSTQAGGCLANTYDFTCNKSHTWRNFSGSGFGTWNPIAPKSRPYQ